MEEVVFKLQTQPKMMWCRKQQPETGQMLLFSAIELDIHNHKLCLAWGITEFAWTTGKFNGAVWSMRPVRSGSLHPPSLPGVSSKWWSEGSARLHSPWSERSLSVPLHNTWLLSLTLILTWSHLSIESDCHSSVVTHMVWWFVIIAKPRRVEKFR